MELEFANPHPANDFAEVPQTILERSIQRQNEKKKSLLSQAKMASNIRKNIQISAPKATRREIFAFNLKLWRRSDFTLSGFSQLVEGINSNHRLKQHRGVIGLNKLLENNINGLIQRVIDIKLVPRMIEFLKLKQDPQLQIEAVEVLTSIASGTTLQTQVILDKGAIFWLINLLYSKKQELRGKSSIILAFLAEDSAVVRDRLIASGALPPLLKAVEDPDATQYVLQKGVYAISNLCRGRPLPPLEKVKLAIPILCKVISSQSDSQILTDAIWALSSASKSQDGIEDMFRDPKVIHTLVSLLSNPYLPIMIPCLKTIGNICFGTEAQIEAVIDHPEFFEKIESLIDHKKKVVRREILLPLSRIAAGPEKQRNKMFQRHSLLKKVVFMASQDIPEIKREALNVFTNALQHESVDDFRILRDIGILDCYISTLNDDSYGNYGGSPLKIALEGIYFMLEIGRKIAKESQSEQNIVLAELENAKVLDRFDALQDHNDESLYAIAIKIIQEFIPSIEIKPRREELENDSDEEDYDDSD